MWLIESLNKTLVLDNMPTIDRFKHFINDEIADIADPLSHH